MKVKRITHKTVSKKVSPLDEKNQHADKLRKTERESTSQSTLQDESGTLSILSFSDSQRSQFVDHVQGKIINAEGSDPQTSRKLFPKVSQSRMLSMSPISIKDNVSQMSQDSFYEKSYSVWSRSPRSVKSLWDMNSPTQVKSVLYTRVH